MIFNEINKEYEILFSQHEFPTREKLLVIKKGDTWIVDNKMVINVLGYGIIDEGHSLKFIFKTKEKTYGVSIFEMKELLLSGMILFKKFISSDNNFLYANRISFPHDTSRLEDYMDNLHGIIIKSKIKNEKKYFLSNAQIGYPDWVIPFRYTTNFGGSYNFSKIILLTKEFLGNVFVHGHSTKSADEFKDSNSIFFSLCGVDISPDECLSKLKTFDI